MQACAPTYSGKATASLAAIALLFPLLTVGLEAAFDVSLKLPGHRALPGAFALLLFAEVVAPWALCLFAAAIPWLLWAIGSDPLMLLPWLGLLGLLLLARGRRFRATYWFPLLGGLIFGGLRYAVIWQGGHHTPWAVRLGGHLLFGLLGGALAGLLMHLHRSGRSGPEPEVRAS